MKRLGNLWPKLISFDNLWLAWQRARRGKRRNPDVVHFELELERNLFTLQRKLAHGHYYPGRYRLFTLFERKPRLIAAAPFRDRIVHHAVMNLIEAPIDRRFIDDSYACRSFKGTHRAVDRYQGWAKRYRYVLKLDVQRYFPSIDHGRLKAKLAQHIKDSELLGLLGGIIDASPPTTTPRGQPQQERPDEPQQQVGFSPGQPAHIAQNEAGYGLPQRGRG